MPIIIPPTSLLNKQSNTNQGWLGAGKSFDKASQLTSDDLL